MEKLVISSDANPNYLASICKIDNLEKIENSDHLSFTKINGYTIVISNEFKIGDIVVYFPLESAICEEFLSLNNLYEQSEYEKNSNSNEVNELILQYKILEKDKNSDEAKKIKEKIKSMTGFFGKNGRVRIVKLRGIYSEGFISHVSSLETFNEKLKGTDWESLIGTKFNMVGDKEICHKFIPTVLVKEAKQISNGQHFWKKRMKKLNRFDRLIPNTFKFHYDTVKLNDNISQLSPDDIVTISVKVHGCVEKHTIINTLEYGDIEIGEIVNKKIKCHIKAYDTKNNEIKYVPIDDYYYLKEDGEWYEIELENGIKIVITGNNPIWLPFEKRYKKVDELLGNETLLNELKPVKIKSIDKIAEKLDRYDLTVNSTKNFYANGILIHNTSAIFSNIQVKKQLNLFEKFKLFLGFKVNTQEYGNVFSSRSVIKNRYINPSSKSGFYKKDVWSIVNEVLFPYIEKGMTIYGEIVGYEDGTSRMIQNGHDYGCQIGNWKFMPYRISTSNEFGESREWNLSEVDEWTHLLVKNHPELSSHILFLNILYHGKLGDLYPDIKIDENWHKNLLERMKKDKTNFLMEEKEPMCHLYEKEALEAKKALENNTDKKIAKLLKERYETLENKRAPREGIVIRKDNDIIPRAWKLKTDAHYHRECIQHDNGETDIEEIS